MSQFKLTSRAHSDAEHVATPSDGSSLAVGYASRVRAPGHIRNRDPHVPPHLNQDCGREHVYRHEHARGASTTRAHNATFQERWPAKKQAGRAAGERPVAKSESEPSQSSRARGSPSKCWPGMDRECVTVRAAACVRVFFLAYGRQNLCRFKEYSRDSAADSANRRLVWPRRRRRCCKNSKQMARVK